MMGAKSLARSLTAALKKTKAKLQRKPTRKLYAHKPTLKSQPCLLGLPAELRNQIYELVVVKPCPIEIVVFTKGQYRLSRSLRQPPLAHVSRQLRDEVLSMFYAENTFKVTALHFKHPLRPRAQRAECLAVRWLSCLTTYAKASLRSIEICTTLTFDALFSRRRYSQLFALADYHVCEGILYHQEYTSSLRLQGWTWAGDVDGEGWCRHRLSGFCRYKPENVHHHALVWTG